MLSAILNFSKTLEELPPFQYGRTTNHWQIELDRNGNFKAIEPLIQQGKKGKLGRSDLPASPHKNRNGVDPKLIVDTAEYVFGLKSENQPARAKIYHQAYLELLERCLEFTQEHSVKVIAHFLKNEPLAKIRADLERYPIDWELESSHVIRFFIDGAVDPTQLPNVQQFWAEYCTNDNLSKQQCLVTGEVQEIATKLEHKLKSIPNTQASGAMLISAYCDSFHSYGQSGAEVSPIGVKTAETLGQTLSYLESTPEHRLRLGPVVYLYWSAGGELDLNDWFFEPSLEKVRALLQAVRTGERALIVDTSDFYLLALSGGGGRAIVRDFLQTTIPEVKVALAKWFEAQELVDFDGEIRLPIGLYALAAQAYRDAAKELQVHTLAAMSRAALTGCPLPRELLHKVLGRVRAKQGVSYRQASLIKLILNYLGVNITVNLDERMKALSSPRERAAYCCGRLLATFGAIQYYALGKEVNATVVDKTYGAASTTPNKVFGQLEAKTQAHLAELRKNKPGIAVVFSKQLEDIHAAMLDPRFPNSLTLEEQGIFAMGYWHQRAFRPIKPEDNAEIAKAERQGEILSIVEVED
jgi:CRISPR-associated protein Csd1